MLRARLIAVIGLCIWATAAQAADNWRPRWYGAVSGSIVYLDKVAFNSGIANDWQSYNPGYGYALATGFQVLPDIRWELEFSDRESDVKHDSAGPAPAGTKYKAGESTAIMTNIYYDFHNRSAFTPYLGAGVGDAYVRNSRDYISGGVTSGNLNAWALSYQFMAGMSYEFNRSFAMNVGYRYFASQDVKASAFGNTITFPNASNNVEAGIRFFFN